MTEGGWEWAEEGLGGEKKGEDLEEGAAMGVRKTATIASPLSEYA